MSIELNKVEELVLNHNHLGLENYLKKQSGDLATLITAKIFITAITEFINSDARNMTNSYNVIISLRRHFFDENRHMKYSLSAEHEQIGALFNICDKVFNHKKYKIDDVKEITRIDGINISDIEAKFALYEERQQRRSIYKIADDVIESQFIYPIKYPDNTSFIRKMLGVTPKRASVDIIKDFNDKLPILIDNLRKDFYSNPKFLDQRGKFLLTESELSEILYERISLKATKQLGLDQGSVDEIFKEYNTKKLINKLQSFYELNEDENISKELIDDFSSLLISMVPQHLVDLTDLIERVDPKNQGFIGSLPDEVSAKLLDNINLYLQALEEKIVQYNQSPWKEEQIEKMLYYAIELNSKLNGIEEKESYKVLKESNQLQLLTLQEKLSKKVYDDHKKHKLPKTKLTDFEKRAISKMALSNDQRTEEDKRLIATFVEYASGNKEFNIRLGNVLKSGNDFVRQYKQEIELLHKYTYKSSDLDVIINSLDKIQFMLSKLEGNPQHKFSNAEKITLAELGKINKYIDSDVKSVLEKISYEAPQIQKLRNTYQRAQAVIEQFDKKIESQINYKEGDLVMDVANKYHKLKLHTYNSFFKWLENLIQDWITPYSHAAIGTKLDNVKGILEIWDEYQTREVDAQNSLITETFRVYPHALLQNVEITEKLMKALDVDKEGLKDKLHEMYGKCSTDIAQTIDPTKLQNDSTKRRQAGLADFRIGGHKTSESVRSWVEKVMDSKSVDGIKISTGEKIICSEFAAKITALTIVALEKELIKTIKEKEPSFALKDGENLLKMPFDKYEDLNKIHPARLIKELGKHGAIEKVESSKVIENMIISR
jgi:hypothetical protein